MLNGAGPELYEVLQISPNADPDTVHRVYRLLAQRFHPDNQATGDPERFRTLSEAYQVLGDPERRAQYDTNRPQRQRERSSLISEALRAVSDVESEKLLRLTVLELLYTRRKTEPRAPGIFDGDLELLVGRPREHLEFALWYLSQRGLIDRADGSRIAITVDGVEHFEAQGAIHQRMRQLAAPNITASVVASHS